VSLWVKSSANLAALERPAKKDLSLSAITENALACGKQCNALVGNYLCDLKEECHLLVDCATTCDSSVGQTNPTGFVLAACQRNMFTKKLLLIIELILAVRDLG